MEEGDQIKARRLLCIVLTAALMALILLWSLTERRAMTDVVDDMVISLDSGFYTDNQQVAVNIPQGAVVFYTDDCSLPDRDNGMRYEEPISMESVDEEQIYVYRFKAFYKDGTESEVETRTYFLGKNIDERYATHVLHLTGDPDGLFGYENGIFVPGKLFDEFCQANPGVHFGGGVDANFMQSGAEWEREVCVQYFDKDGKELLSQNCGVRINGGMTRMKNQKSFRLYARKEYDEQNEFDYPFLDGLLLKKDGTLAQKYKRLTIRSGGTDNGFGFIRSELGCELAGAAGFPDVMYSIPVCVYINGSYQGVYWLENGYDGQYFENRYGEYEGEFVVLEGSDKFKDADGDAYIQTYVNEFNELYLRFSETDLTVQKNYEELQQFIDVENYLQYFAIENYVGNMDWPSNNLKVYRYVSQNDEYEEGTVFDGRYRYLLYDLDYGFGLNDMLGVMAGSPDLERIMGENTPLFAALMKREDCRQYFINYTCDLMNGAMSAENMTETLQEMHASRQRELYYMLEEAGMPEEAIWNWESAPRNYETVETNYNKIIEFAATRPSIVLNDIINQFNESQEELYALNVFLDDIFSTVQVNSIRVQENVFSGIYFANVPVTITPCMAENEVFDYWIVNGSIREEEELRLYQSDVIGNEVHVELAVHETEEPLLAINAVKAKGNSDFIELINLSHKPVSTLGYFLSDDEDPYKYALPVMTLKPGETRRFYGRNCMDSEGLGQIGMNFNLKRGETITLTYGTQALETLLIPDLTEGRIYKRDGNTGKFVEVISKEE